MTLSSAGPDRQRQIYTDGAAGKKPLIPTSFEELEKRAARRLAAEGFAYIAGSAGRESTASRNRATLDAVHIVPRMLRDVAACELSVKLFGNTLPAPLFTCPIGVLDLAHQQADLAVARAVSSLGLPMAFSNQASVCMEECAAVMGDTPRWFQLYWSSNDDLVASFLRRAENCGCRALLVTLDTTMLGWRHRDLDQTHLPFLEGKGLAQYITDPVFQGLLDEPDPPAEKQAVTLSAVALMLRLCRRYPGSFLHNLKSKRPLAAVRKFINIYTRANLSWDDLPFLRRHTNLPIVLKGILHPDDALKALDLGVDGIYVSNHGGRQVDGAVGALEALDRVARAVKGRVPVLFDSGIRGGADIFKALALGADAVGIGRPYAYALAVAGQAGVEELLRNYMADLHLTMVLSGVKSVGDICRDHVNVPFDTD